MAQFVITAYDGEGMLDKRMEVRPLHLEGMERLKEHLIAAGGMLDDEGKLNGSVLIMEFHVISRQRDIRDGTCLGEDHR